MRQKKLADIPAITLEQLKALAALAPPDADQTGTMPDKGAKPGSKSRRRKSAGPQLGSLDIEKYLAHYGVVFNVKKEGEKTLYRLAECVFDPSHRKNEASIVQDLSGLITYHCFHNTCQDRRWNDARALISGTDNLAQFCEGYDPNRAKKRGAPSGPPSSFDTGKASSGAPSRVPPPQSIDPGEFFDGRTFIPQFLAKYLEAHFNPLAYDGGDFYRYDSAGVWRVLEPDRIGQVAEQALDKMAKSARIEDAIKLMSKRVFIPADRFKHNPRYVNVKNGLLDTTTLELIPHDPKFMSRIQLAVEYDPGAQCPLWSERLFEICSGDIEKLRTIQMFFGYSLLPDCRFQHCLFLIGAGANGKGVIMDILIHVLGQENVCSLPLQLMGQRFLIGQLKDKLVNVASEVQTNQPLDTANFKDAITGGLLMADAKHGKPFTFYPIAKHIFSMNLVPKITDKSYGFQRRPIVITLRERFKGDRVDPLLTEKLKVEAAGIFTWMVNGLECVVVRDTLDFMASTNPVLLFVEDCCVLGKEFRVKPPALYEEYKTWCEEGKNRPLSRNRFYDQILINFIEVSKKMVGKDRQRYYVGMGLKDNPKP